MSRTTGCGTLSQQLKWQAACCRPEDSRIILSAFSSFFIVLSFLPFVLPLFILLYLVYFFPSLFPFLIFLVFHLSIFPPFIPPHLFDLFTSFLPNFTLSFLFIFFFPLLPSHSFLSDFPNSFNSFLTYSFHPSFMYPSSDPSALLSPAINYFIESVDVVRRLRYSCQIIYSKSLLPVNTTPSVGRRRLLIEGQADEADDSGNPPMAGNCTIVAFIMQMDDGITSRKSPFFVRVLCSSVSHVLFLAFPLYYLLFIPFCRFIITRFFSCLYWSFPFFSGSSFLSSSAVFCFGLLLFCFYFKSGYLLFCA